MDKGIKLIYKSTEGKIKIFGKSFIFNNQDNCKIKINEKEQQIK